MTIFVVQQLQPKSTDRYIHQTLSRGSSKKTTAFGYGRRYHLKKYKNNKNLKEFYDKLEQFKNLKSRKGELKQNNCVYHNPSAQ